MTTASAPRRTWVVLLTVVALGLLLRLGLIFMPGSAGSPEVFEYDQLARNLLSGQGYVYTHLGPPYRSYYGGVFYIWLTAGLYAAFSSRPMAVLIAQSLASCALAVVVFLLGRRLWSERAGVVAAFLVVTHPAFVYTDTHKLHPLSFDSLMMSLALFALLCVPRSRYRSVPTIAGLLLGAAILQRGSVLLLLPLGLLWLWRFSPRDKRVFQRLGGYLLGVVLVVAPWVGRNYLIHGVPLLLTPTAEHFWVGNASHSYGSNLLPTGGTVLDAAPAEFRAELLSRDEFGQVRLFWQSGLEGVGARPWAFLSGVALKFLHFWTFAPQTGVLYPRSYVYIYAAYYGLVAGLALVGVLGLARAEPSRPLALPGLLLILTMFLSVSTIHSVFYFELRHRWGVEPELLVISAGGGLTAWRWVSARSCGTRPGASR